MREKEVFAGGVRNVTRITPACAGKSMKTFISLIVFEDHPRMCGKKGFPVLPSMVVIGSPPHVREKDNISYIPLGIAVDHPRMCGKKVNSFA